MNDKIIYFIIDKQDQYIDFWYEYYYQHSIEGIGVRCKAGGEENFKRETKWLINQFVQSVYGQKSDILLWQFYKKRFSEEAQMRLSISEIETNTIMYERAIRTFLQQSLKMKELDVTYEEIEIFVKSLHVYHEHLFLNDLKAKKKIKEKNF